MSENNISSEINAWTYMINTIRNQEEPFLGENDKSSEVNAWTYMIKTTPNQEEPN